jgi:hypothetical protein
MNLPLPRSNESTSLNLAMGKIKGRADRHYLVLTEHGLSKADRSAGCLLEPEVGDLVLLLMTDDPADYVLHVLERGQKDEPARLSVEAPELKLAAQTLNFSGQKSIKLTTEDFEANALRGRTRCGELAFEGGCLSARIGRVQTWARFVENTAERLIDRMQRCYRHVEEFEESNVGRFRLLVKDLFFLGSKNATLKADGQVKIDGDKIHLG